MYVNIPVFYVLTGYPVVNDPLYNHEVFGPEKGKYGNIGKTDEELIQDLISIHNAENWLGMDIEAEGGNVLCTGLQDRSEAFSKAEEYNINTDKAQRVEASSTTKNGQVQSQSDLNRKEQSIRELETMENLNKTSRISINNANSTSPNHENNGNGGKGNRSETPDSAVDVNSLPASADSPSSSSSTTSSYSSSLQYQNNQNVVKNSTSTATSVSLQTCSPTNNALNGGILHNEVLGSNNTSRSATNSVSSNISIPMSSTIASSSTLSPIPSLIQQDVELNGKSCVTTIATQTGIDDADERFDLKKLSYDSHCYECKVKYRDPSPNDLVMFLHAYTYTVRCC